MGIGNRCVNCSCWINRCGSILFSNPATRSPGRLDRNRRNVRCARVGKPCARARSCAVRHRHRNNHHLRRTNVQFPFAGSHDSDFWARVAGRPVVLCVPVALAVPHFGAAGYWPRTDHVPQDRRSCVRFRRIGVEFSVYRTTLPPFASRHNSPANSFGSNFGRPDDAPHSRNIVRDRRRYQKFDSGKR